MNSIDSEKIFIGLEIFLCPEKHYIFSPSDSIGRGFKKEDLTEMDSKKVNLKKYFEELYYCPKCDKIYKNSELINTYKRKK
jgi:uncharacterized C2H2 Zn-finger protein